MSLDKQKILSDLGSVMNQLQSADCGCMGKLFNNRNSHPNMNYSGPGSGDYRHGCCRCPGYNRCGAAYNGDPTPTMGSQNMNYPCMGRCNPAKLYSDTYQYLNSNLMQPVVQEVYNDLKSITPANTIMNTSPGNPLSPSLGQTNMPIMHNGIGDQTRGMGHMSGMSAHTGGMGGNMSGMGGHTGGMGGNMSGMGGHTGGMGGNMAGSGAPVPEMGSNIVNMMMGGHKPNANGMSSEGKSFAQPMVIDAPQSPHGAVGVVPLSNNMNAYQASDPLMHAKSNQQHFLSQANPTTYGQHSPGVNKFNNMFPGVMQNFGGDLGFDPMAIAVQMNPANQQRAAFDTMQKLMNGNTGNLNRTSNITNLAQPQSIAPAAITQNLTPADTLVQPIVPPTPVQQSTIPVEHLSPPPVSQPVNPSQGQTNYHYGNEIQPVYTTAVTPEPNQQAMQQQQLYQGQEHPLLPPASQYVTEDPSNTLQVPAAGNENVTNPYSYGIQQEMLNPPEIAEPPPVPPSMQMEKVPIFPVDVSKNQSYSSVKRPPNYGYNTLGQPIQRLSASRYRRKDPGGPQTLSPQDPPVTPKHFPKVYSNVKATVSKTSIMGNRRTGRNPSRSQLQHIYNQYKGSQSLTLQNAVNNNEPVSYSDGKLNVPQQAGRAQPNNPVVVEKVGGDTVPSAGANNEVAAKPARFAGQIGDVPLINKTDNEERVILRQRKGRNGLQDMVYTSYPTSTAWTFHGNPRLPLPPGVRASRRY